MFLALGAPDERTKTGVTLPTARGSDLQARFVVCALDMAVSEYRATKSTSGEKRSRERSLREVLLDGPLFPPGRTPRVSLWTETIGKMHVNKNYDPLI